MVEGCAKEIGDAREIADHYNGLLHTTSLETGTAVTPSGTAVHLGAVDVHHGRGGRARSITPGAPLQVVVDYEVLAPLHSMVIEVSIQPEGSEAALIEANTESDEFPVPCEVGRHTIAIRWDRLDLGGGRYHVHVGAYSAGWRTTLAYAWEATSVIVAGDEIRGHRLFHLATGRSRRTQGLQTRHRTDGPALRSLGRYPGLQRRGHDQFDTSLPAAAAGLSALGGCRRR